MTIMEFWYLLGMIVSLIGYVPFIVIIIAIFMKYPIRTLMKAKAIGLNPLPNRRLELVALSDDKELARTGDGSFVFTKPEHYYIESKTRKPIVLMDSTVGQTISIDAYRLMDLLKQNGYNNYDDLAEAFKNDSSAVIDIDNKKITVNEAMLKQLKKDSDKKAIIKVDDLEVELTEKMIKSIKDHGQIQIKIKGESLPIAGAVDFFKQSIPGTVIETMLQYRSTVEALRNKKKDLMQWIVILGFFVICIGFAVLMLSYAAPPMANIASNTLPAGSAATGLR